MKNPATFRRAAAAAGLVTTVLLMVLSTTTAPEFPAGFAERLSAIEEAGTRGVVSALAFGLAQLPFLAAVLGVGHLIRAGAPVLSNVGTTLAVVGGFGHAAFGGTSLVILAMAADTENRAVHAAVLEQVESGPAAVFMAMGLLGTVLGILLLAIGLGRAHVGPTWVPYALGAFLVVEFVGSSFSEWAASLAVLLYAAAFGALAVTVWRSPTTTWETGELPQPSRAGTGRVFPNTSTVSTERIPTDS